MKKAPKKRTPRIQIGEKVVFKAFEHVEPVKGRNGTRFLAFRNRVLYRLNAEKVVTEKVTLRKRV